MGKKRSFLVEIGQLRRYFDTRLTLGRVDVIASAPGDGRPLLEQACSSQKKKIGTLVLDLDETLVYMKCARGCLFNCNCGEGDDFYMAMRPGVDSFLHAMAELYELVLWTASPQPYAEAVLQVVDPQGQIFSHRLYRQHLDVDGKKDLSRLGRDLRNVIMVDDSSLASFPSSVQRNVIRIKRYIADGSEEQEHDTSLVKLEQVLRQLASSVARGSSLQEGLAEVQTGVLDDIGGVAASRGAWCPSWRKKKNNELLEVESTVHVEMPVYVPEHDDDEDAGQEETFGGGGVAVSYVRSTSS